jgi:hypothetical protein
MYLRNFWIRIDSESRSLVKLNLVKLKQSFVKALTKVSGTLYVTQERSKV